MKSEAYRINRENPEAIRRSAQRAVLDMISISTNAYRLLNLSIAAENRRYEGEIMDALARIESEVKDYLRHTLRISDIQQAISAARQLINDIKRECQSSWETDSSYTGLS